jgi:uncharacterized oxidoreductase
MPRFAVGQLEQYVIAAFEAAGSSPREARVVGEHLINATLAGHDSHGVTRLPQYFNAIQTGAVALNMQPKIVSETCSTATLDGQNGFGQVIANEAMTLAIGKARACGVSTVAIRNSYHSGCIGNYAKSAAGAGMIGIIVVNAGGGGQYVAPFGGRERRLATNPLAVAVPSSNGYPLVLDIATSVAPEGKVRAFYQTRKPVPPGWMTDSSGTPSTDAKDLYESAGALLPLGGAAGYKGYGLSFMIDILAGALSGAGCCRLGATEAKDGLLMIVIDIKWFAPLETFYNHVATLVDHIKSCPPSPGFKEVFVPGELEVREEKKRRREGIVLEEGIWREIREAVASVGLTASPSEQLPPRIAPAAETVHGSVGSA